MSILTRASAALVGLGLLAGNAAADAPAAELAAKARAVFQTYCHRCHGQEGTNEGGSCVHKLRRMSVMPSSDDHLREPG
jgi:mono/diheme cytochrome c family protein